MQKSFAGNGFVHARRKLKTTVRHAPAQRVASPLCAAWFGKGAQAPSSARKQQLLDLTNGSLYGSMSDSATAQQVERLVDELAASGGGSRIGSSSKGGTGAATALDGSWRLVYTSEKSVHSIVRGLPVCFVGQRISIGSSRVTNVIDFGEASGEATSSGGSGFGLRASAPLTVTGPNRIEYRFDSFKLLLPWRRSGGKQGRASKDGGSEGLAVLREQEEAARLALPLPTPRAGGWTQGVFVDGEVRVMRNSLGDTLIFVREEI